MQDFYLLQNIFNLFYWYFYLIEGYEYIFHQFNVVQSSLEALQFLKVFGGLMIKLVIFGAIVLMVRLLCPPAV